MVRRLEGILNYVKEKNLLPPLKINMLRFEIQDSHRKIFAFIGHAIRNQVQNNHWEGLMHQMKPHQAFVTFDWAMKFLSKKYRETSKDWVSFSYSGCHWKINECCFMKQKYHFQRDLLQYENATMPLSSSSIHTTH